MSTDEHPTQHGFELTLGRAVTHETGEHDALVHVWWRCDFAEDCLVQAYLNGDLVDVAADAEQRELWMVVDRSVENRVELLAVRADDVDALWTPQPGYLRSWSPPMRDRVEVLVVRDESLPVDTRVEVVIDGAVVADEMLWPGDVSRSGFGGLFGLGGFGQDAASGLGLGRGALGYGPLGIDGTAWRWRSEPLAPGPHSITLTAKDAEGRAVSPPQTLPVVVTDALPAGAITLTIQPDFTLAWTH